MLCFKVDEITVIVFKNILFCVIVKDLTVYNIKIFGSRYYSFLLLKIIKTKESILFDEYKESILNLINHIVDYKKNRGYGIRTLEQNRKIGADTNGKRDSGRG